MWRAALAGFLLAAAGCTAPLTPEDALPFQACSRDFDCVPESLDCSSSCASVAVARDQVIPFEQERGCWPPKTPNAFCEVSCQAPVCAAGRCALASGCRPGGGPI